MNCMPVLVTILYVYSILFKPSLLSRPTSQNGGRSGKHPYFIKSPQAALKASALTPVKHATNFRQKFRRSFRVDIMLSDNAPLQLRKRPDLSTQTLQNDKAHTNNAAVCAL